VSKARPFDRQRDGSRVENISRQKNNKGGKEGGDNLQRKGDKHATLAFVITSGGEKQPEKVCGDKVPCKGCKEGPFRARVENDGGPIQGKQKKRVIPVKLHTWRGGEEKTPKGGEGEKRGKGLSGNNENIEYSSSTRAAEGRV